MSKRDYYEVLGVAKGATEGEIKKAYRKLVLVHHPDKGGDEEKFKEIAEAYDVLSTPNKKVRYDTHGHNEPRTGGGRNGGMNMDDIFSQFRRSSYQQPQRKRGRDIRVHIELSLEDVFQGVTKKIKYKKDTECIDCQGHGGTGIDHCGHCNGKGFVIQNQQTQIGLIQTQVMCNICKGEGKTISKKCKTCKGVGVTGTEELVDVTIPIGIDESEALHVRGGGNNIKDGESGNLLIHIKIKQHEFFTRDRYNLHLKLDLHYHQLVIGTKVEIPTIEGTKIRFEVLKGSQVGKVIGIPNKGLKELDNETVRGRMLVTLSIIIPEDIDSESEEIIKKLGEKLESVEKI